MTIRNDPIWVSLKHVIQIQQQTITEQGGSPGLRDQGLLESALARPQNHFSFGEEDIFLLAATYAEGLAKNHAFVDGNKRVAYLTADIFLYLNGYDLQNTPHINQITLFEDLARDALSHAELAEFYRRHCRKIPAT